MIVVLVAGEDVLPLVSSRNTSDSRNRKKSGSNRDTPSQTISIRTTRPDKHRKSGSCS